MKKEITECYSIFNNEVYYNDIKVAEADYNEIVIVSDTTIFISGVVYVHGKAYKEVDASTFKRIEYSNYYVDKNHAYFLNEITLKNNKIRVLKNINADIDSFNVTSLKWNHDDYAILAYDKNQIFINGQIVKNIASQSPIILMEERLADSSNFVLFKNDNTVFCVTCERNSSKFTVKSLSTDAENFDFIYSKHLNQFKYSLYSKDSKNIYFLDERLDAKISQDIILIDFIYANILYANGYLYLGKESLGKIDINSFRKIANYSYSDKNRLFILKAREIYYGLNSVKDPTHLEYNIVGKLLKLNSCYFYDDNNIFFIGANGEHATSKKNGVIKTVDNIYRHSICHDDEYFYYMGLPFAYYKNDNNSKELSENFIIINNKIYCTRSHYEHGSFPVKLDKIDADSFTLLFNGEEVVSCKDKNKKYKLEFFNNILEKAEDYCLNHKLKNTKYKYLSFNENLDSKGVFKFNNSYYYNHKLLDINTENAKIINDFFIIDEHNVYYKKQKLKFVDPNSIEIINNNLIKDKNSVFIKIKNENWTKLDLINSFSFFKYDSKRHLLDNKLVNGEKLVNLSQKPDRQLNLMELTNQYDELKYQIINEYKGKNYLEYMDKIDILLYLNPEDSELKNIKKKSTELIKKNSQEIIDLYYKMTPGGREKKIRDLIKEIKREGKYSYKINDKASYLEDEDDDLPDWLGGPSNPDSLEKPILKEWEETWIDANYAFKNGIKNMVHNKVYSVFYIKNREDILSTYLYITYLFSQEKYEEVVMYASRIIEFIPINEKFLSLLIKSIAIVFVDDGPDYHRTREIINKIDFSSPEIQKMNLGEDINILIISMYLFHDHPKKLKYIYKKTDKTSFSKCLTLNQVTSIQSKKDIVETVKTIFSKKLSNSELDHIPYAHEEQLSNSIDKKIIKDILTSYCKKFPQQISAKNALLYYLIKCESFKEAQKLIDEVSKSHKFSTSKLFVKAKGYTNDDQDGNFLTDNIYNLIKIIAFKIKCGEYVQASKNIQQLLKKLSEIANFDDKKRSKYELDKYNELIREYHLTLVNLQIDIYLKQERFLEVGELMKHIKENYQYIKDDNQLTLINYCEYYVKTNNQKAFEDYILSRDQENYNFNPEIIFWISVFMKDKNKKYCHAVKKSKSQKNYINYLKNSAKFLDYIGKKDAAEKIKADINLYK